MASTARTDELKKKFDENPRRYFAPLANEFRKMGELDQAIMICEEFLPQQPGHMSGHIVYGQALFESGKLAQARVVFETALGLDPENLIALRHLGDISKSEGDLAGARRWYDRVLDADPRNEEIQGLLASLEEAPAAEQASAQPEMSYAPAVPALPGMRSHAPAPELAPIDLDFGGTKRDTPSAEADEPPSLDERPDAMSLDDSAALPAADSAAPAPLWESAEPDVIIKPRRTEGFEAAEFEAPDEPMARAEGLEPSEFEAPTSTGPRAEGLEENPFAPTAAHTDEFTIVPEEPDHHGPLGSRVVTDESESRPSADLESVDGFTLAPHGDALTDGVVTAEHSTLDASNAPDPSRAEGLHNEDTEPDAAAVEAAATSGLPMMETSASIIAAEATLIETGASLESTNAMADDDVTNDQLSSSAAAPFVTETMAELYMKQGFRDRALAVYQQLSDAAPDDARLRAKVAELKPRSSMEMGPTVREFFAQIAGRRPGERVAASVPPSNDDFAAFDMRSTAARESQPVSAPEAEQVSAPEFEQVSAPESEQESVPEPEPVSAPEPAPVRAPTPSAGTSIPAMSSGAERGATAQGIAPAGSIDALFGNRSVGRSEDSAASALAQAFSGSMPVVPAISGRPARPGSSELSLDSVFRDGPPRPARSSQSFSFDQFFSDNAATSTTPAPPAAKIAPVETAEPGGEPAAERGADDIQQFNSWLQGLKQK